MHTRARSRDWFQRSLFRVGGQIEPDEAKLVIQENLIWTAIVVMLYILQCGRWNGLGYPGVLGDQFLERW